ncbi:unnamed protein product, partial [Scytosiphon promiscuus]
MRVANGSQSFRRDSDGPLGRGEGTNETEPFLFPRNTRDDHDHPAEELSVHRIQLLARRCAFPFARRIPRVTKRRTGQLLLMIWLCWIVAACVEWRAQHSLRRRRKQLVAFLQETTFYVVEEGQLSEGWQSPLQRRRAEVDRSREEGKYLSERLRGAKDRQLRSPATRDGGTREGKRTHTPLGYGSSENTRSDGLARDLSGVREPEDQWRRQRDLASPDVSRRHETCPLIYTVDPATAKKHGLFLFQEELELLGTVTARLCRCLCHAPLAHAEEDPQQDNPSRATLASTKGDEHFVKDSGQLRRRLGVCEGDAHALMLEEMLKGANVVISGDSGWFYRWFESMQDAYARTCSHFSTRSTLGIPEGTVLRTVLTG